LTGPNPVDRGKAGSKIHALSDRAGLPLAVGVSAANTNDHHALKPLVMAVPAVRSRRGPRRARPAKLHGPEWGLGASGSAVFGHGKGRPTGGTRV